jgi:hypothetical protein
MKITLGRSMQTRAAVCSSNENVMAKIVGWHFQLWDHIFLGLFGNTAFLRVCNRWIILDEGNIGNTASWRIGNPCLAFVVVGPRKPEPVSSMQIDLDSLLESMA